MKKAVRSESIRGHFFWTFISILLFYLIIFVNCRDVVQQYLRDVMLLISIKSL